MNFAMATLSLKEMGQFLWKGRDFLPSWLSQFSFAMVLHPRIVEGKYRKIFENTGRGFVQAYSHVKFYLYIVVIIFEILKHQ